MREIVLASTVSHIPPSGSILSDRAKRALVHKTSSWGGYHHLVSYHLEPDVRSQQLINFLNK